MTNAAEPYDINWSTQADKGPGAYVWGPYMYNETLGAVRRIDQINSIGLVTGLEEASDVVRSHMASEKENQRLVLAQEKYMAKRTCPDCNGFGALTYLYSDDLPTWAETPTNVDKFGDHAVPCGTCWGSGNEGTPWTDLRQLQVERKTQRVRRQTESLVEVSKVERMDRMTIAVIGASRSINITSGADKGSSSPAVVAGALLNEIDKAVAPRVEEN